MQYQKFASDNHLFSHIFITAISFMINQTTTVFKTKLMRFIINKSTTAVDPQHSKVKEQDISLTRNYCIIVSIQIITSIHTFILKIQKILESRGLKHRYHLWTGPLKNHWINFSLSWTCHDQTGHIFFWLCQPKTFFDQLLISVNLYQNAKN